MFQQAVDRFSVNFGTLLGIQFLAWLLSVVPVFLAISGMVASLMVGGFTGIHYESLIAGIGLGSLLLGMLVSWLLTPLGLGAVLAAIYRAVSQKQVLIGQCFTDARRSYLSLLLYLLMSYLTMGGVMVVVFFVAAQLGSAVGGLLSVLAVLAFSFLMLPALAFYAPYALVGEGLSAGQAYSRMWVMITQRMGEMVLMGLVVLGLSLLAVVVSGLLSLVPYVGGFAALLAMVIFSLFLMVYIGVRYETNVKPHFM